MNTIIVWLLISIGSSSYNHGNITVVERFATEADCNWVKQSLKDVSDYGERFQDAKCVKAKIAVVK